MNLESQVCALDQANKLKALGVSQSSLWHFALTGQGAIKAIVYLSAKGVFKNPDTDAWYSDWQKVAAYTAAELGEMLPSEVATEREPGNQMHVWVCSDSMNYEVAFSAYTEAQAKADMLIWLLEEGHEKVEDINARLAASH